MIVMWAAEIYRYNIYITFIHAQYVHYAIYLQREYIPRNDDNIL